MIWRPDQCPGRQLTAGTLRRVSSADGTLKQGEIIAFLRAIVILGYLRAAYGVRCKYYSDPIIA